MGYHVYITRAADWSQVGACQIRAAEWLALIARDAELSLRPDDGPHVAEWSGDGQSRFDWERGNIVIKNPGEAVVRKMLQLAERLNASVQGDDGEIYVLGDNGELTAIDAPTSPAAPDAASPIASCRGLAALLQYVSNRLRPSPFRTGDRVSDLWGNEGTVIRVDRGARTFRMRRDDGVEIASMFDASLYTRKR